MRLCKTLIHQISSQLNISCKCIRQTIYKFDKFHTVATKPGAGRTPKVTEHQKRLIKLQQVRDDTLSFIQWCLCFQSEFRKEKLNLISN